MGCIIIRNYVAGRPGRYDTFLPNAAWSLMTCIGRELTLGDSKLIAEGKQLK